MKLISTAITVLALALTAVAGTQSKPSPSTPAPIQQVQTYTAPDGSFTMTKLGTVTVDGPKDSSFTTTKGATLQTKMTVYHSEVDEARYGVVDVKLDHVATEDDMANIAARFINGVNGQIVTGTDTSDREVLVVLIVPGKDGQQYGAYFRAGFYGNHVFEVLFTAPYASKQEVIGKGIDFVKSVKINQDKLSK